MLEEGQGRRLLHYVVEIRRKPAQAERAGKRREEEGEEGKKNRYTASTGDTWWQCCVDVHHKQRHSAKNSGQTFGLKSSVSLFHSNEMQVYLANTMHYRCLLIFCFSLCSICIIAYNLNYGIFFT